MNFFEFLDIHYRNSLSDLQKNYDIPKDAHVKAAHSLIGAYRTLLIWAIRPVLLAKFLLVKFDLMQKPELHEALQPKEEPKPKASSQIETNGQEATIVS